MPKFEKIDKPIGERGGRNPLRQALAAVEQEITQRQQRVDALKLRLQKAEADLREALGVRNGIRVLLGVSSPRQTSGSLATAPGPKRGRTRRISPAQQQKIIDMSNEDAPVSLITMETGLSKATVARVRREAKSERKLRGGEPKENTPALGAAKAAKTAPVTAEERREVFRLLDEDTAIREVARRLNRAPSTISRLNRKRRLTKGG